MTKTFAAVALAALAILAPSASARTPIKSDAAVSARLALSDYADHRCNQYEWCDYADYPSLTRYDCSRGRGAIVCDGTFFLNPVDDNSNYGWPGEGCTATVTVRYARGSTWRLVERVSDVSCT